MTWFNQLFGFDEREYAHTQGLLRTQGEYLYIANEPSRRFRMGSLETPTLAELRARVTAPAGLDPIKTETRSPPNNEMSQPFSAGSALITVKCIVADARAIHLLPQAHGSVIQVASQFNLLEMPHPDVQPEQGITAYAMDKTQGPACAMAGAAATLYRNYLVSVGDGLGQSQHRQLNMLADLTAAMGSPAIQMKNGYAMLSDSVVRDVCAHISALSDVQRDELKQFLRIGLHQNVGVTLPEAPLEQAVTHALCSALPIAYNNSPVELWEPFARLVLEASYEATLCAAVLNYRKTNNPRVYLTFVGGGVFGNAQEWICDAMEKAICSVAEHPLEVYWVNFRAVPEAMEQRVRALNERIQRS